LEGKSIGPDQKQMFNVIWRTKVMNEGPRLLVSLFLFFFFFIVFLTLVAQIL
jgi:hypothetical protein